MLIHTDKREYTYVEERRSAQPMIAQTSVFHSPGKVTIMEGGKWTGIRRDTGKRWYRWSNTSAVGFRRTSAGNVVPYNVHRAGRHGNGKWANGALGVTFGVLNDNKDIPRNKAFIDAVQEEFGVGRLSDVYPISEMYSIAYYEYMPKELIPFMREQDFADFVARTFGKKQMRKDLIKSAAKVRPDVLAVAREFRGIVPVDWIVNFLRLNEEEHNNTHARLPHAVSLRGDLRGMDPRSYRALLNTKMERMDWWNIRSVAEAKQSQYRQVQPMGGERIRTWAEYHDKALPPYRLARGVYENERVGAGRRMVDSYVPTPPKNEVIPLVEMAKTVNGPVGDMVIKCAEDTDTMRAWSTEMRNCISGYTYQAISGQGIYAGIYRGEKLIANFELKKSTVRGQGGDNTYMWQLSQLLGKGNSSLPPETLAQIEGALRAAGVNVPTTYWGAAPVPTPIRQVLEPVAYGAQPDYAEVYARELPNGWVDRGLDGLQLRGADNALQDADW